jgi:2-keto-4-pentenoate hydratase/2-oxohepta-3-ene-1,7-dioic acid hydratase in catechol pathway
MKLARYEYNEQIYYGRVHDDGSIEPAVGSPFDGLAFSGQRVAMDQVRLLAPLANPRIFGVGFNYVAHIKETGWDTPSIPMLFVKPITALAGPDDPIILPRGAGEVHYESELVVVIGRPAHRVSEENALDYVMGYTCGNDVSDRDIQRKEMKFGCLFAGKAFETFAPLGPVIETDLDPSVLSIIGRLNGEVRQRGNTSDLLFSVPQLIAYMSSFMKLMPGDVIMTGTPSGVGPLQPGDVFETEIEGIGTLSNPVIAEGE